MQQEKQQQMTAELSFEDFRNSILNDFRIANESREREIRLVVAAHRLLAAEDEARLKRLLPDAVGEHLIHADAAAEHGAFHERHAGEEVAGLAGLVGV